jgi:ribosomal protein S12 methylthiotransferase accessory factor
MQAPKEDRAVPPSETVARVRPHLARMGITRLADLSGLDRIGVPVFAAVRPNARSVATSQGKGLTPDAARAAALMEAVESWHAERPPGPLRLDAASELRGFRLVDLGRLPRLAGTGLDSNRPILWSEGNDLVTGEACLLPYEIVHTDYRLPQPPAAGCFPVGSNGLGAGNTRAEAIRHALLELIERDAVSLWQQRPATARRSGRIALEEESGTALGSIVERLTAAGFGVGLHDVTSDLEIPTFLAVLTDRVDPGGHAGMGSAAHLSAERAVRAALLEAVQVRTSYIAGARDDLVPAEFAAGGLSAKTRWVDSLLGIEAAAGPLRADAPASGRRPEAQVVWLLERLAEAGMHEAIAVDLDRAEIDLPVVRVVVPGLEGAADDPGYLPGARALAAGRRG